MLSFERVVHASVDHRLLFLVNSPLTASPTHRFKEDDTRAVTLNQVCLIIINPSGEMIFQFSKQVFARLFDALKDKK